MNIFPQNFYHLYNRSNNKELIFKEKENYLYFLNKYRRYLQKDINTIAYCLMPTHFHFLIFIKSEQIKEIRHSIGLWLSSYTKAINKKYQRHGNLFQQHTRTILIDDQRYLLTLIAYIHQNPLRSKLVSELSQWPYSSYLDLCGKRKGTLPDKSFVNDIFGSVKAFEEYSQQWVESIKKRYWIQVNARCRTPFRCPTSRRK
jgi:putative transposase